MGFVAPLYHWPPKKLWNQVLPDARQWGKFSAYVHFPFCRSICDFCAYETRKISRASSSLFVDRANAEIGKFGETDHFSECDLSAIFFGGGTASLLPERAFPTLIESLQSISSCSKIGEITLECEPGTITRSRLKKAVNAGVNRISVCAQTMDEEVLSRMGRKHSVRDTLILIEDCVALGINNIHVDLIYGMPWQSMKAWENTLQTVTQLPATHISTYKLFVFLFGKYHRRGVAPRADEESDESLERARQMWAMAVRVLSEAGFVQYTLTEFTRSGMRCKYLEATFGPSDILPIGPGAFGRCGAQLLQNDPHVSSYLKSTGEGQRRGYVLQQVEMLKREVIMGLWLLEVDLDEVYSRHGLVVSEQLQSCLLELEREQAVSLSGTKVRFDSIASFDAGIAMAALDKLPAELWAKNLGQKAGDTFLPPGGVLPRQLGTMLSAARREPELYFELSSDPCGTINKLGVDLDENDLLVILNIIHGDGCATTSWADEFKSRWGRVVSEHEHRFDRTISSQPRL